jgi:regulator of sigma E protease
MDFGFLVLGIIAIILAFCLIIAFHEFCHLIAAKLFGVKVPKYSIGFGKPLASKKIGETEYAIGWILLGGYVKPLSEEEAEIRNEKIDVLDKGRTLESRPRWQQMIIMVAGPIGNLILGALLIFTITYFIGFESPTLKIAKVAPDSPAYEGGLRNGDLVVAIDDKNVADWRELAEKIQESKGNALKIEIMRQSGNSQLAKKFTVTPVFKEIDAGYGQKIKIWFIGVEPKSEIRKISFIKSAKKSVFITYFFTKLQFDFLVKVLKKLIVPKKEKRDNRIKKAEDEDLSKNVAGPIGIFQILYSAFKDGIRSFIYIVAILNFMVGFMNLLPIYPIDGGRILFLGIEMVMRRSINRRIKVLIQNFGILLFLLLMIWATTNDISRLAQK